MRTFSEFEKKIIQELVKTVVTTNDSNILSFMTNTILHNKGIYVNKKEKTVNIIGKPDSKDNDVTEIFETIALIQYLESNHLVFKHTHHNTEFVDGLSSKISDQILAKKGNGWDSFTVPTNMFDIIQDFHKSFIVVGAELKKLVENDFKTTEQIHHEKEIKIARLSLLIAFIALLFSFLFPVIFSTETKIEQKQIDDIRTDLHKINSSIDTLNRWTKTTIEVEKNKRLEHNKTKNTSR
jgi:hypothetical protein